MNLVNAWDDSSVYWISSMKKIAKNSLTDEVGTGDRQVTGPPMYGHDPYWK